MLLINGKQIVNKLKLTLHIFPFFIFFYFYWFNLTERNNKKTKNSTKKQGFNKIIPNEYSQVK